MRQYLKFYIDGQWVAPTEAKTADVINPATEQVSGQIALGTVADVDKAVAAARKAFASWSQTSREARIEILLAIQAEYNRRLPEMAEAIMEEMGAPSALAHGFHVGLGSGHLQTAIEVLKEFKFEEQRGATRIVKEPIGVCALITPWNWPMNQIARESLPGARHRLHHDLETTPAGAVFGPDPGGDHPHSRRSRRRLQHAPGQRPRHRHGAVNAP